MEGEEDYDQFIKQNIDEGGLEGIDSPNTMKRRLLIMIGVISFIVGIIITVVIILVTNNDEEEDKKDSPKPEPQPEPQPEPEKEVNLKIQGFFYLEEGDEVNILSDEFILPKSFTVLIDGEKIKKIN